MQMFTFIIKYLFSILLKSQRIYWCKHYEKMEFFTDSHKFKHKCKFQFLRKK